MHGWKSKQINGAHDAGEGKVSILAHLVELVAHDGVLGDTHRQDVFAGVGGVGDIHLEWQGATLMIRQAPAIHPNFRTAINALKAELEPPLAQDRKCVLWA